MTTSVIIPTYNGAHKILNILHCLEQQTVQADEVIIVIDGSTDNTEAILAQYKYPFQTLRVINQSNGGRAQVRNRGAHEATGDLLIFFDDDMLPERDCLYHHIKHHQQHSTSILTGAQIDINSKARTEAQQYKAHLTQKWSQPLIESQGQPLSSHNLYLTAANCSVPQKIFRQLNGFDARLLDAEDYDLGVRALKAGIPIYYNHLAYAWHDDQITFKTYINRLRQYDRAQKQLMLLKPELYASGTKYHIPNPKGLKRIIFEFFSYKCWIDWADKTSDLKRLAPRWLRYRIYDVIVTANGIYFPDKVSLL